MTYRDTINLPGANVCEAGDPHVRPVSLGPCPDGLHEWTLTAEMMPTVTIAPDPAFSSRRIDYHRRETATGFLQSCRRCTATRDRRDVSTDVVTFPRAA